MASPRSAWLSCRLPILEQKSVFEIWPWHNVNLDDVVHSYSIKSISLRIKGRHRGRGSRAEPFRYGEVDTISHPAGEAYISASSSGTTTKTARSGCMGYRERDESHGEPLSRSLSLLDGWIDLADVTSYMSGIRTRAKRSLRDTLLTFGLAKGHFVQSLRPHDPGMDATRTEAALAALEACPTRELDIPNWTFEEKELRRQLRLEKQPSTDRHPHAIRICTQDGSPMSQTLSSQLKLENLSRHVSQFQLRWPSPRKPERKKTHGWICFDTLSAMEYCVEQLNGYEVDGVRLYLSIDS